MAVIEMDKKPTLTYTPLFVYWMLFIGYAFLYSFTFAKTNPELAASFAVFQGLYVLSWLWMLFTFKFKEDRKLDSAEAIKLGIWIVIGLSVLALLNIITSVTLSFFNVLGFSTVWINSTVYTDFWLAMLAGYCEEIAFTALAALVWRLAYSKKLTLVLIGILFPLFHIISYPNLLTPNISALAIFILLMAGRVWLSALFLQTDRIEVPIFVHALWDGISIAITILTAAGIGA